MENNLFNVNFKNKHLSKIIVTLLLISICFNFIFLSSPIKVQANSINNETQETVTNLSNSSAYSIFIKNPSFSFVYENYLYFFDLSDKNLKIFNLTENSFESTYLSFENLGNCLDISVCEGLVFALFESNQNNQFIVKLNLSNENIEFEEIIKIENETLEFNKISTTENGNLIYIVLTPKIGSESKTITNNPYIYTYQKDIDSITNELELVLNDNLSNSIKNSLFKIMLSLSSEPETYLNLILVCSLEIYAINLETESINLLQEIILTDTNFYRPIDSSSYDQYDYAGISLLAVNLLYINNTNLLALTYNSTTIDGYSLSYTKFYIFNLSLFGTGSTFENIRTISSSLTNFVCSSKNGITYPDEQSIYYIEIDYTSNQLSTSVYKITNPNITVNYYDESEFIYAKTNKNTGILSLPWSSTESINIDENTDLIIIGEGYVASQNLTFEDFKYCLYTNLSGNYLGYVNVENLDVKQEISVDESSRICTVISGAPLYSLPTKITGTTINSNLSSKIIMNIQEYSRIEIIDMLCGYSTCDTYFVKVMVNNNEVGYIDKSQIQNKNEITLYPTNNASIKLDNANIYLNEGDTNVIIATLSSGTRIQVNGTKNTKTGYTYITFTDEYGNVFSGYVNSDYVEMDGWTNLQFVGCIFIAINLGLLILILYFKRKRLVIKPSNEITNDKFE